MASIPKALYYCNCDGLTVNKNEDEEPEQITSRAPPLDSSSQLLPLRAWPIEKLYYCDDCSELRCPRCVIDEPAGYHCPNCLFDVPTASVRSENNCCARNCFQCPICTHVLSVVEGNDGGIDASKPFSLVCSVCMWDSREIGWSFEKATGISSQIERTKGVSKQSQEYNSLLEYWRAVHRASSGAAVMSSSGFRGGSMRGKGSISGYSSLRSKMSGESSLTFLLESEKPESYKAACYEDVDHMRIPDLMSLTDGDTIPPMSDPNGSVEPKRVRLHMKLSRRCRKCHHILIKPESKAQATRFKIQLVASHFLPTITVPYSISPKSTLPHPPYSVGRPFPALLRFSNPHYTEMKIRIAANATSDEADVELGAEEFTLQPYTEFWEYEDDEDEDDGNGRDQYPRGGPDAKSSSKEKQQGIVEQHGNRATILLNVTPHVRTDNLIVPFKITTEHLDLVDESIDDDDLEKPSSSRKVVISFWVYISLGKVE